MDDPEQTLPADPASAQPDANPAASASSRVTRSGRRSHWLLLYTRGLILDQRQRRLTMFYVVLAAMLMAFSGDLLLGAWLQPREHFFRFAFYWLACGWLTILAALLAIYDLIQLRLQARLLERQLRERMLRENLPGPPPPGPE